jgi:hypothetical protein
LQKNIYQHPIDRALLQDDLLVSLLFPQPSCPQFLCGTTLLEAKSRNALPWITCLLSM